MVHSTGKAKSCENFIVSKFRWHICIVHSNSAVQHADINITLSGKLQELMDLYYVSKFRQFTGFSYNQKEQIMRQKWYICTWEILQTIKCTDPCAALVMLFIHDSQDVWILYVWMAILVSTDNCRQFMVNRQKQKCRENLTWVSTSLKPIQNYVVQATIISP